jgi:6-phosphogluconolactonase
VDAATGQLTQLNQQPSQGTGPCHLVVDRTGKNVIVVNYSSGSVTVVPLGDDGRLRPPSCSIQHEGSSVDPARQKGPHAHSVNLDAGNRFAFVADLGLDKVLIYRFDAEKGLLEANRPPFASLAPGAGPRHFAFHPNGRFAYVINEMQSTVTAFRFNLQSGELTTMQSVSALPTGYQGKSWTAEVQVHPSGKFLYGSNRGHDSIAIFGVDPETGMLTAKGHEPTQGKTPRNFALDPTGTFLLAENQESGTIVVFRIDAQTGLLTATGQKVEVPSPVCVKMIPLP